MKHLFQRLTAAALLAGAISLTALPAAAQEGVLEFDVPVEEVMTADEYEFKYKFTPGDSQYVVAYLENAEVNGSVQLYGGELVAVDPNGETVVDTMEGFNINIGFTTIVIPIEEEGDYTLVVTRSDGAEGTDEGGFRVRISDAPVIEPGTIVEGRVDSDNPGRYYVVTTPGDLSIFYRREDGDSAPSVTLYGATDTGLDRQASFDGNNLDQGALYLTDVGSDIMVIGVEMGFLIFDNSAYQAYSVSVQEGGFFPE